MRDDQARLTRGRILDAAIALYGERGYSRTTMAAVAAAAKVSTQTIYNTFGGRPALLKAVYDAQLAGDDDPVAMVDRPLMAGLRTERNPVELLRLYAQVGRVLIDRVGAFVLVLEAGAAAGDTDLAAHIETIDGERLIGCQHIVDRLTELEALSPTVSREQAIDTIWTLNSVQVWNLLANRRGWSGDEYQEWVGAAMCAAVLGEG
ncbi:TetR/AcrR family transcriptional regulator [Gordonia sp. CPCC 205515]|uniref:TetR/AcrR family transcriptional regulator n=1 Tax=Gordonia sp. CPCC 205515 TaxID=3140791 RepID=UPI003AF3F773